MQKRILISGAGVAGPALALCLRESGFAITLVERAKSLREGGQAVDFRGPVHRAVLERLNIWEAIRAQRTNPSELVLLRQNGSAVATLPGVLMSGDVEILRGDLSRLLYDRTRDATDYRFDDHVTAIEERDEAVIASFASGETKSYDYVVGADGLHSKTRSLVFGADDDVLQHHGYRIASFATENLLRTTTGAVMYTVPGRAACVSALDRHRGRALLVYAGDPLGPERRDLDGQRRAIREIYRDVGWEIPRVLDALDAARDLYVDAIASVHVSRYHRGRVVLLGDAAWGGTLGGQGTSLAIVGAWVLAGELTRSADPAIAFARFDSAMRRYATRCQAGAKRAGSFFAPKTRIGVALRNAMYGFLTSKRMLGFFEKLVKEAASDFVLPEYT
ncbi:MAG TPA: FAD-dependent monooxygenase [Polyangiaceae bacterium]|nr:FAD-dependent monooxygenase [Polyangiaceae bacterium]